MLIYKSTATLKDGLATIRQNGESIGFVPTMGALHAGHMALIARAHSENDWTVCSIFVNPIQFNNSQDFAKYPRDFEKDIALLVGYPRTILFLPTEADIYPELPTLRFDFGLLERVMEGAFRPGHFNGVGIVVAKLFHAVQPSRAYFGQKDLQQCRIVQQMVKDLGFDLELIVCPTSREADGLAMSSRNQRLSPEQRSKAVAIPQALEMAKDLLIQQKQPIEEVKIAVTNFLKNTIVRLEYFEIVHSFTLQTLQETDAQKAIALCIAGFVGEVRLIDNIVLEISGQ
jgi:pantoate--beta-alanine ligase